MTMTSTARMLFNRADWIESFQSLFSHLTSRTHLLRSSSICTTHLNLRLFRSLSVDTTSSDLPMSPRTAEPS
eukprot:scaffold61551_cov41-Prasinocladus_malaysianus.AAC.1